MRRSIAIFLPRAALTLLGTQAFIAVLATQIEGPGIRVVVQGAEQLTAGLVLVLAIPGLAGRLDQEAAPWTDRWWERTYASLIEAALYGLLFLLPFSTWILANLDSELITLAGHAIPRIAPAQPDFARTARIFHQIGAGLALGLIGLHLRNYGTAMVMSALRDLARRSIGPFVRPGTERDRFPHRRTELSRRPAVARLPSDVTATLRGRAPGGSE